MKRYRLPAHTTVPYSWDMPAIKDKKIILNAHGRERSINLQEIGSQLPFRHQSRDGQSVITSIDVKTQKAAQVVYLSPYNQSQSYFRPLSPQSTISSSSTSSDESRVKEGFETKEVKTVFNFVVELQFSQIGISTVNKHLQVLLSIEWYRNIFPAC